MSEELRFSGFGPLLGQKSRSYSQFKLDVTDDLRRPPCIHGEANPGEPEFQGLPVPHKW